MIPPTFFYFGFSVLVRVLFLLPIIILYSNQNLKLFLISGIILIFLEYSIIFFDGEEYSISLKTYDNEDPKPQEFSHQGMIPAKSNLTFIIADIPSKVSFIIFQIHTFQSNVTLSYSENFLSSSTNDSVIGSNIGLFYDTNGISSIKTYVMNSNNNSVEALFVALSYRSDAPIPGGCNMEFNMEISPFQKVLVSNSMIIVDAQPSSMPGNQKVACDKNLIQHDAYHLYLPGQDFTNETYFSTMKKLLTPENIMRNGEKIPKSLIGSSMRRVYSTYPGVGSVYAMIATYKNQSSAYVPSFTYGCSDSLDNCGSMLPNGISKTVCVFMIFLGLYLMLFGHKTPNGTIFIFSCLQGGLIGYILTVVAGTQSASDTMWIAIGSGLLIAFVWQVFSSCFCGGTSRIFSNFFLAFFFSCIIYYKLPDKALPLENDFYFWAFYCSVALLLFVVISMTVCLSGVFCCSILGSYLFIIAIDYYTGSTLKYIIINFIRRITIPGFDVAIINPPFGSQEITLTVFWVIFALISFLIQISCRPNGGYKDLSIPVAHMDSHGEVHFAPWRDNFRAHRNLRKMYR